MRAAHPRLAERGGGRRHGLAQGFSVLVAGDVNNKGAELCGRVLGPAPPRARPSPPGRSAPRGGGGQVGY
jgi:hypothetical protein